MNPAKEIYSLYLKNNREVYISKEDEIFLAKCIIVGNKEYLKKLSSITPYSYKGMDGLTATSLQSEIEDVIKFLNYSNKKLRIVIDNSSNSSLSTWLEITRYMNSSIAYMLDFESLKIDSGWAIVIRSAIVPLLFDQVTIIKSMMLEARLKEISPQGG